MENLLFLDVPVLEHITVLGPSENFNLLAREQGYEGSAKKRIHEVFEDNSEIFFYIIHDHMLWIRGGIASLRRL